MSMRSTRSRTLGKDPKCDNAKKMSSIADSSASNIDDSELNRTKKTNQVLKFNSFAWLFLHFIYTIIYKKRCVY